MKNIKLKKQDETPQLGTDTVNSSVIRPPLGLMPLGLTPKKYFEKRVKVQRYNEVCGAIVRYYEAGLKINIQWIEEYNELVDCIGKHDH